MTVKYDQSLGYYYPSLYPAKLQYPKVLGEQNT